MHGESRTLFAFCPTTAKMAFRTRKRCKKVGKIVGRRVHKKFGVYVCPMCGYWHLTTHSWRPK